MSSSSTKNDRLIWLDLEMTGLDHDQHTILEIGCALTDGNLDLIAEGPTFAISHPANVLAEMDPWCIDQHGRSGLTQRVKDSTISMEEAEQRSLDFLRQHCAAGSSPLCGNSIGQDRRFLYKYMPRLNAFFHYRNVDVSTVKELVKRWYPPELQAPTKQSTHHVIDDIRESIAELKYYREKVFK